MRVELVREVGRLRTYKIIYNEDIKFETTLVGKTFNYGEGIDGVIPEAVLDFVEKWILEEIWKRETVKIVVIKIYRNKKNKNKYIEVHNDGYYHNAVKQYMYWTEVNVKNLLGDRKLHRWRKGNLKELLEDYEEV